MPKHHTARSPDVDPHTSGDGLEAWGGIVSAHLTDWAEALGCTPEAVLKAVSEAEIDPLVDTLEQKVGAITSGQRTRPCGAWL